MVLICISLMRTDVVDNPLHTNWPASSFLVKCLIKSFVCFSIGLSALLFTF